MPSDDLYLGPDDEVEYESMPLHISRELYLGPEDDFNGGIGAPEPSHRVSSDPPGQAISPALHLGPEEMSDEHMEYLNPPNAECLPAPPALDNKELQAIVREFWPFGSYHDVGSHRSHCYHSVESSNPPGRLHNYSRKPSRAVHTAAPGGRATILNCLGGDI
ncbi:uncharacterized protein EDB91DRAFT_1082109 [Suillus paluster]|uniref:uncharacterized protein n=1 Tax=Suillus paluster TaxID=48578 RepID=UPI001B885F1E|nr:uncharacterized protein EDB91DRAFT_1082109 [Suillus paluster]KAG1740131.1 hypothetical protein EDB91DRAFT_1082109 [Suillus paluster]